MRTLIMEPEILLMDEPSERSTPTPSSRCIRCLLGDSGSGSGETMFCRHARPRPSADAVEPRRLTLRARRARLKEDFEVPFPRPRDAVSLRETEAFGRLYSHIWHALGEEFGGPRRNSCEAKAFMIRSRPAILLWQIAILLVTLSIWEWGFDLCKALLPKPWVPKILDPYFISKPTAIWRSSLKLGCLADSAGFVSCYRENANNLWLATLVTLKNMWWGFLWGRALASSRGLVLGSLGISLANFRTLHRRHELDPAHCSRPSYRSLIFGLGDLSEGGDGGDRRVLCGVLQYLRRYALGRSRPDRRGAATRRQ